MKIIYESLFKTFNQSLINAIFCSVFRGRERAMMWGVTRGSEGVRGVPSNYRGWMIQLWSKKIRSQHILSFLLQQGDLDIKTGHHLYFLIYPLVSVSFICEIGSTPSVAGGGWCGVMSSLWLVPGHGHHQPIRGLDRDLLTNERPAEWWPPWPAGSQ